MQCIKRDVALFGRATYYNIRRKSGFKQIFARTVASVSASSVDVEEIERFGALSPEWLSEDSFFKPLYSYNKIRVPWVVETVSSDKASQYPLRGKRILDVACGGGILTIPLARLGGCVVGIDASKDAANSASKAVEHFIDKRGAVGSVEILCSTIEEYSEKNEESFDAVIASEVVEHVNDLEGFMGCCIKLACRGSPLFFTTLNKTFMSRILAIYLAEEVFKVVPSGVHEWEKFVAPSTLRRILEKNNCDVRLTHGVTYNPFINEWSWSSNTSVSYAMLAYKL